MNGGISCNRCHNGGSLGSAGSAGSGLDDGCWGACSGSFSTRGSLFGTRRRFLLVNVDLWAIEEDLRVIEDDLWLVGDDICVVEKICGFWKKTW